MESTVGGKNLIFMLQCTFLSYRFLSEKSCSLCGIANHLLYVYVFVGLFVL